MKPEDALKVLVEHSIKPEEAMSLIGKSQTGMLAVHAVKMSRLRAEMEEMRIAGSAPCTLDYIDHLENKSAEMALALTQVAGALQSMLRRIKIGEKHGVLENGITAQDVIHAVGVLSAHAEVIQDAQALCA